MQSTLKNGVAIVPLLTLGAAASTFGVAEVLVLSPFLLLALAVALLQLSLRFGAADPRGPLIEFTTYWDETEDTMATEEETA
jgi:hypothetical protein